MMKAHSPVFSTHVPNPHGGSQQTACEKCGLNNCGHILR